MKCKVHQKLIPSVIPVCHEATEELNRMLSAVQRHLALPTLQVPVFNASLSKSEYTQDAVPARTETRRHILRLKGGFLPGKVTKVRVNRSSNYFTVDFLEVISSVTVCNNFSWTDKSEVQRVEEEHNVFS